MSPALKRYRDAAIVIVLLAVPFFVLKANMKAPENQNVLDHTLLRLSTPIEVAASTFARGVSNVLSDYDARSAVRTNGAFAPKVGWSEHTPRRDAIYHSIASKDNANARPRPTMSGAAVGAALMSQGASDIS